MTKAFTAFLIHRSLGALAVCLVVPVLGSAWYTIGLLRDPYHYGWRLPMASAAVYFVLVIVISFQMGICVAPLIPLQGLVAACGANRSLRIRRTSELVSTLLSSAVTAMLYDYVVPQFRWYTDDQPDWVHGLTWRRYGIALLAQIMVLAAATLTPNVMRSINGRGGAPLLTSER